VNSQFTVAITLACLGVVQAALTLTLSGSRFFSDLYEKLLDDFTESEEQFRIARFFHDEADPDKVRIKRVATVSGTASTITSQCVSLTVTALGTAVLAVVTYHRTLWFLGSLVLTAVAIGLCVLLLRRSSKNKLLTFGMRLRGWRKNRLAGMLSLDSVNPYVALQLVAVAYAAAAGFAVQTSGSPPALTLKDSAAPGSFNAAGRVITYHYQVSNTGAGILTGITITDPAEPGVSCPAASLAPGATEMCTGSHIATSADLAAGKITDTATAAGATTDGVSVTSNSSMVTVPEGWPSVVTGTHRPPPHAAEGYYLGVTGSTWSLIVTHPGGARVVFTGTVTLNAGAFSDIDPVQLESSDSVQAGHQTLTFRFVDFGYIDGVQFTTSPANTKFTCALTIGGHSAAASQIFLGGTLAHPHHGSPLTFTR
jgi:hypothetical protein